MIQRDEKRKSRSIPLMDYYEILQMEYLSYYFRNLDYERVEDKVKYSDFCKKKKESIEKLSFRNCFPSIFSDENTKEKYLKKFFNQFGIPNFTYRDDHQKEHLGFWDRVYYFKPQTEVIYRDTKWEVVNNLCRFEEPGGFVVIRQVNKPTIKVGYSEVSRVLDIEGIKF